MSERPGKRDERAAARWPVAARPDGHIIGRGLGEIDCQGVDLARGQDMAQGRCPQIEPPWNGAMRRGGCVGCEPRRRARGKPGADEKDTPKARVLTHAQHLTLRGMMNRILMALLCASTWATLAANAMPPASDATHVQFNWGVKITLRDGIRLNATVYLPKDQAGPAPCIFTLTPYVSDTYHARGIYFAAHGFPFAIVDVRGRGNSEGLFHPMIQEAHDGYDVVEWLARQPFCNGKVTMWGGSYAGYDQWATAKELPPHLATIVPVASPYAGIDFPMRSNILYPYVVQWLTYTSGHTLQEQIFGDEAFWSAIYRRWYESGRSFGDLDAVLGNALPTFHEWLSHPEPDAYWDAYNPTAEQYAQLRIPILT